MTRGRPREAMLVAAATLAFAVVLYPGALLRGEAFFERDLHLDWYPRLAALFRCLRNGSWPFWEPGLGFGQPLLGDPSLQALYPVTWLSLALPWRIAYTAFVLVHLFIACLGALRLARRLGSGRAGAWAAGLAFALSGPVQSAVNLWTHFASAAWAPWVLLAVDGALVRPGLRAALTLAAAVALQFLAGSPDVCAWTYCLALAAAVVRLLELRGRRSRRAQASVRAAPAALAGAAALAVALSCAVWWPAVGAVSRSSRRALPEAERATWSVPALGLARIVVPLDSLHVPFDRVTWTRLYDRPETPLLYSLYLGLPVLGLAFAALLERRRFARTLGLATAALLLVGFAMGPHGPLYGPLTSLLPPFRMLRFPSKAMLPAALVVSLLAGLGMRSLCASVRARILTAGAVLLGSCVSALAAIRFGLVPAWSPGLGIAFALALVLYGPRLTPRFASWVLVTLAVAELAAAHRELNATAPASILVEPPPVLQYLRSEDGSRVHVWDYHTLPANATRHLGRDDPYRPAVALAGLNTRVQVFVAQRQVLVPMTSGFFGLETSFDFDVRGLYPHDLNDLVFFADYVQATPVHTKLLRLGAVAKVVALHERGLEGLRLEQSIPTLVGDPLRVFAVPDPMPRAWLVGRTRIADAEAAFRRLADPSFDPRVEAIVADGPELTAPGGLGGSVRWLERRADQQRIETTSDVAELLVFADAYDPGWRASVDGNEATVVRANVAFRGVAVPPGRHEIELVYRPRAVVAGLGVSGFGLLLTAALFVASRKSRGGPR